MKEQEAKRRLDPPLCSFLHLSSHTFFVSLFSLMSVLSIGSQCESMAIIYTHSFTLYYAHIAIASLILWPSVCLYHWLVQEEADGAFKGTDIVGIHYVVTKKRFIWDDIDTDHFGSGVFINHRLNSIAFIPTDHISHVNFVHL